MRMNDMAEPKEPEVGDYRIVEDLVKRAEGWSYRFRIERFCEGGSFLWWKWSPSWRRWSDDETLEKARALIEVERSGIFEAEVPNSRTTK